MSEWTGFAFAFNGVSLGWNLCTVFSGTDFWPLVLACVAINCLVLGLMFGDSRRAA